MVCVNRTAVGLPSFSKRSNKRTVASSTSDLLGMNDRGAHMKNTTRELLTFAATCLAISAASQADERGPESTNSQVGKFVDTQGGGGSTQAAIHLANLRWEQVSDTGSPRGRAVNVKGDDQRKSTTLEEIVVTATKRRELLQDVPISIAVVTADDIDRKGLVGAEYLRGIPGVNQMEGGHLGQAIIIRGLETGTSNQNFGAGGTMVATYFGETPTTTSGGLSGSTSIDLKLVDIARVEVLRGPQGTAFGNSSMGGVVRTIPVLPDLDNFEGKVAAGYSVTSGFGDDNYNIQAVGNLPLLQDKLAVRVVGYRFEDSGYYRNVAGSDADYQAAIAPFGGQPFAVDEDDVGASRFTGGRISALLQVNDALKFTVSYLHQETETDGWGAANSGRFEQTLLQVAPEHVVRRGHTGPFFDTEIDLANAVMELDFEQVNLLATYSYTKSKSAYDWVFSSYLLPWPASEYSPSNHRAHVGEVRMATKFDGPWNFLVGVYTEDLKDDGQQDDLWHGDLGANPLAPGERFLAHLLDQRELEQKAVFGEVAWRIVKNLTLTGGARMYDYERTYRLDADGPFFGEGGVHEGSEGDASGTIFRANLSYELGAGAMVYGGWSQGFRLGRPQVGLPVGTCDVDGNGVVDGTNLTLASLKQVGSDEVDNYEIGGKFALFDNRMMIDAAVFRMDWSDMPIALRTDEFTELCHLGAAGAAGVSTNAGKARSEGVELQANFRIGDSFRVDIGGSYIKAELAEDALGVGREGDRLPGTPEVSANLGLEYEFDIAGRKPSLRLDTTYVSDFYTSVRPPPPGAGRAGDYVKLDAAARFPLRNFNLDIFVRNLTNEDAFTARLVNIANAPYFGSRMRPRTVGLQLSYDF